MTPRKYSQNFNISNRAENNNTLIWRIEVAPKKAAAPIPPGVQHVGEDYALGVDIYGLAALANKLYGYAPPSEEVVDAIESSVRKLVSDASWKGDDANAFQNAWDADAREARKLPMLIDDAGMLIDNLATSLAELQLAVNDRILNAKNNPDQLTRDREVGEIARDATIKSKKLQEEAADHLVALYSGKNGSWSLLDATKERTEDEDIPKGLRDRAKDVEDELDDSLPDDHFDASGFLGWMATGAGIGATIGAPFEGVGAIPGAIVGGFVGLGAGAVAGGGKWAIDQLDDLF
jgi:uncharacterized protein YukE